MSTGNGNLPPVVLTVVVDAGPLGKLSNPKATAVNLECKDWLEALMAKNARIMIPEIADYEVRRELLRGGKVNGLRRLNWLVNSFEYLELSTAVMRRAAELWADLRRIGRPMASDDALDADVILCAQTELLGDAGAVIATENVQHLSRLWPAKHWRDIK
jgi:predicted nucleic acid-binding protein